MAAGRAGGVDNVDLVTSYPNNTLGTYSKYQGQNSS